MVCVLYLKKKKKVERDGKKKKGERRDTKIRVPRGRCMLNVYMQGIHHSKAHNTLSHHLGDKSKS